ncbi:MAG: hypothetical protein EOO92_07275 [Pedobacter sp.]|nr:MAG: hypothetical protein EOO92_07275 [Pedobacter sp.]
MNRRISIFLLIIISIAVSWLTTTAQTLDSYGGSGAQIQNEAEVISGKTENNYLTVSLGNLSGGLNLGPGWTYRVRANGNFVNGLSAIPSQYISLQLQSTSGGPSGITGGTVPLTATDSQLANGSQTLSTPPTYYMEHKYNIIIQGGSHLLIQNTGTFSTTLTISLYNASGTLVTVKNNVAISFQVNYSNYCQGAVLGGQAGTAYNFDTYAKIANGATVTDAATISYNPNGASCKNWSLRVRADGNFVNGSSSVSPQYFALRFNRVDNGNPSAAAIGTSNTAVTVGAADVTLINQSNASFNGYTSHKFDMVIQGGNHLMQATTQGTYTCKFIFSLYNFAGQLVSTQDVYMSFVVSFSNTCNTAIVGGSTGNIYNFNTYASLQTGGTQTDAINFQYNTNAATCIGWTLKVRANGNFVNGSSSVPPQFFSLRFGRVSSGSPSAAAMGVTNSPVSLGLADVTLINQSNAPFSGYTEHKFDLIIQGGNHLSAASTTGTYSCPLIFSLYNQAGQLVSSTTINARFQISYNSGYNFTMTFTDPNVNLSFNTPSDYTNGKSVSKTNGLRIVAYSAYEVLVKTVGPNLISGSNTMPVSIMRLENTPPAARPGITSTTVSLSATDQRIILNTMPNYLYQTVDYNLRYFTNPGNTTVASSPSGSYTTQIIYVILPQ